MVLSILGTLRSLVWAMLLLLLVMYIFGVYVTQQALDIRLVDHPSEVDWDPKCEPNVRDEHLQKYFGTLVLTVWSLYSSVSGGLDWRYLADPLMCTGQASWGLIFMVYTSFTSFAFLNVVTGIFVDNAMKSSSKDKDMVIHEELSRRKNYINDVRQMFFEADRDHSGQLTWSEFAQHLNDPRVKAYFNSLELEASEARGLFTLLDTDGTGLVSADEFIMGCVRLKGGAKGVDVATLMYENKKMLRKLNDLLRDSQNAFKSIQEREQELLIIEQRVEGVVEAEAKALGMAVPDSLLAAPQQNTGSGLNAATTGFTAPVRV